MAGMGWRSGDEDGVSQERGSERDGRSSSESGNDISMVPAPRISPNVIVMPVMFPVSTQLDPHRHIRECGFTVMFLIMTPPKCFRKTTKVHGSLLLYDIAH